MSESGWKGLDEHFFFPLHIISQRRQSLPDLEEPGKHPACPVARASCARVQHIWKENKVALGRAALGGDGVSGWKCTRVTGKSSWPAVYFFVPEDLSDAR